MKRGASLFLIFILSLGFASCARKSGSEALPIMLGKEPCAECHMIIADQRFAGEAMDQTGEVYKFDDIGCLKIFTARSPENFKKIWVFDFYSSKATLTESAFFMVSDKLLSPMGYRIAAFMNESEVREAKLEMNGQLFGWDELPDDLLKRGEKK